MKNIKKAIFGLGCFWGVQSYFDKIEGILETEVGYAGGEEENANYENIGDHTEVIKIIYDEDQITYRDLIEFFIEKRDLSFDSYKRQYDSLILYDTDEEKEIINELLENESKKHSRKLNVRVEKFNGIYYKAEEYHQKYNEKASGIGLNITCN